LELESEKLTLVTSVLYARDDRLWMLWWKIWANLSAGYSRELELCNCKDEECIWFGCRLHARFTGRRLIAQCSIGYWALGMCWIAM